MTRLRPFFSYYGSKWKLAPLYPQPKFDEIIEPFAGSACYSLLYPNRKVHLFDKSPIIIGIWNYLIRVSEAEILNLPDLECIEDGASLVQEARDLIGFWFARAAWAPRQRANAWSKKYAGSRFWGADARQRIASQLYAIRHWTAQEVSFSSLENRYATWFIDAPYEKAGIHYPYHQIDYAELATFCQTRYGQVLVCEDHTATWLPFVALSKHQTNQNKQTTEALWLGGLNG